MQNSASNKMLIFLHLQGNLYYHINLKQNTTLWSYTHEWKTTALFSYGLVTFQKAKTHSAELNKVHLWTKGFMYCNATNLEPTAHLSGLIRLYLDSGVRSAYSKRRTIFCSAGTIYSSDTITQAPLTYALEQHNQHTKFTPLTSTNKVAITTTWFNTFCLSHVLAFMPS
jgi:hypothetical protein